jgi:hypothetical protein
VRTFLGEAKKTGKYSFTKRQKIGIIVLILVTLVSIEVYAHYYVQVSALPVLTEEEALKQLAIYQWWNGTYAFVSNGGSWFVVWRIPRTMPSENFANFFIFKIGQNSSIGVLRTDLQVLKPSPTSNSTAGCFVPFSAEISDEGNYTAIVIPFDVGWVGTYKVDFDIHVRVYQETLLGLVPKEDIELPMNVTLNYSP